MSRTAFIKCLKNLNVYLPTKKYEEQYFVAFDLDGNKSISLREFVLGLLVTDPEPSPTPSTQWLRCRFEMIFKFYDLNGDNMMDEEEFLHFVRHLLRAEYQTKAGEQEKPHENDDILRAVVKKLMDAMPIRPCVALDSKTFIHIASSSFFEQHNLHLKLMFRLPPFRQKVKKLAERIHIQPGILKNKGKPAQHHTKNVTIVSKHNTVYITPLAERKKKWYA